MKQFIKVNNKWIDTQAEHDQYGRYYYVDEQNYVIYTDDEYLLKHVVGKLQNAMTRTQLQRLLNKHLKYANKLIEGGKAWNEQMIFCEEIKKVLMP